ncbi:hypothetical protein hmeg3_13050 [Herbaspirillum sp. meg3]|uniref:protein kinase domain-containing protein n=1 Tax=Herbaspirillum sp. meg3 TaxID=2025949 RepID=UPI000B999912|nr:hypothetical protein [Herbaspirillum sp. meg3]ASU39121.1 hypothetical protein hmeg3_13050 [Herbaspirillum sp. meg3]
MSEPDTLNEDPSLTLIRTLGLTAVADRYEPVCPIGASYGGSSFVGRDLETDAKVFMKYLICPRGPIEKAKFQLERDALKHPALFDRKVTPTLLHYEEFPDLLTDVIVTNFIDGESLSAWLKRSGTLSMDEKLAVFHRIVLALSGATLIFEHRDVHPGNILLLPLETVKMGPDFDEEEIEPGVRILDWGEAMPVLVGGFQDEPDYHFTMAAASPTMLSGSITNLPPETFKPHKKNTFFGGEYDSWGMGLLLYSLLTDKSPPRAPSLGHYAQEVHDGTLKNWVNREVISTTAIEVPGGQVIQWLLRWLLEIDPTNRATLSDAGRVLWDVRYEEFFTDENAILKEYFKNPREYVPPGGWAHSSIPYYD